MLTPQRISNALEDFIPFNHPASIERLREVANKELGETEKIKEECLKEVRKLVREHEVTCITEDDFLLRFLRTKKFDVQRSFQSLRNYALQRAAYHEKLMNFKSETLKTCLQQKILGILPYRDTGERLILFMANDSWDPSICSDEDMALFLILLTSYAAVDPSSQVNGLVVLSVRSISLPKLPYFMRNAKFIMNFHFNCQPIRFRSIHCIDEPFFFKYILRLLFPFMPKKITERIFMHGKTREILFQHIAPNILPDELGGSLGPLSNDHLIDIILDYLQKFKDEQRHFIKETID